MPRSKELDECQDLLGTTIHKGDFVVHPRHSHILFVSEIIRIRMKKSRYSKEPYVVCELYPIINRGRHVYNYTICRPSEVAQIDINRAMLYKLSMG